MALDFTGDSEIQMIKVKVPVLVTKRDYDMYEVMLPDLGPVNGGYISQKLARKDFELMFKLKAIGEICDEISRRAAKKEMDARMKRGEIKDLGAIGVFIKIVSEKDVPAEAKEAQG